ncbi:sunset domain-containing protein [Paracoccus sp. 22332]|uniref:sunset domain-containing protein n=1 Tax=Paracoccus sp. 22332 TaxID=3453913 RepID=UPI003F87AF8C
MTQRERSHRPTVISPPTSEPQGAAQAPWEYRANRWQRAVAGAPGGCTLKGHISAKGERIYHAPWSSAYGGTQIDESRGEGWFCNEAEAVAAGWRGA